MLIPHQDFLKFSEKERESITEKGKPVIDGGVFVGMEISEDDFKAIGENHGIRGLGDLVALFAKPIAKAIGLENCGGCDQRQEDWNKALPFR